MELSGQLHVPAAISMVLNWTGGRNYLEETKIAQKVRCTVPTMTSVKLHKQEQQPTTLYGGMNRKERNKCLTHSLMLTSVTYILYGPK